MNILLYFFYISLYCFFVKAQQTLSLQDQCDQILKLSETNKLSNPLGNQGDLCGIGNYGENEVALLGSGDKITALQITKDGIEINLDDLHDLPYLEKFVLRNCRNKELPESVIFSGIKFFSIRDVPLERLPKNFGKNPNLETVILNRGNLTEFPYFLMKRLN